MISAPAHAAAAAVTATATATAEPLTAPRTESETRSEPARPWRTIVWDDPVNLMSYVTYVFRTHFGYSAEKAEVLMLAVHEEGRAVVSSGARERMEADVEAMHRYGLWATLEQES